MKKSGLLIEVTFSSYKARPTSKHVPIPIYMKKKQGEGGCRSANFVSKRFRGIEITEFRFCPSTGAEFQAYIRLIPQQGMHVDMTESSGDEWLILLRDAFHSFLLEEKTLPVLEQIIVGKFFIGNGKKLKPSLKLHHPSSRRKEPGIKMKHSVRRND